MRDMGKACKISVDGTDFILQQQFQRRRFYSHKSKTSGYRYEVALCIQTGYIVWTNGPFPCGAYPDINIFRRGLRRKLLQAKEKAQADKGYRGEPQTIILPNEYDSPAIKRLKADVRLRHETINKLLKQFGALKRVFRHDLSKHKAIFDAVATLTQLSIATDGFVYQVQYGHLPLDALRAQRDRR